MESTDTKSLFYTASSAINKDFFPKNNIINFTNLVPYTIMQREPKKFFIKIRNIAISKILKPGIRLRDLRYMGYAKIHINELEPNSVNSTYEKCVGRFNFRYIYKRQRKLREYIVHEFKNAPFQELITVPLPQISIRITDSRNRPLELDLRGPPTLIDFELVEMDTTGKFTMTCMSHGADELRTYPNNTITSFQVKCPQEIRLRKWEVALASIGYPPDLISDANVWWSVKSTLPTCVEKKFKFNLLDYPNTEKFLSDVTNELADDPVYKDKIVIERVHNPDNDNHGYVQFKSGVLDYQNSEKLDVAFSHGFTKAMGQAEIQPPGQITSTSWVTFKGLPSITLAVPPSVGILLCDIVQASALGHELRPILRTIPINTAKGNYLYEPEHLIFHPVINRSFTQMAFMLRRPDGALHDLHSRREHLEANGGIVITLIFRPRSTRETSQFDCETVGVGACY